MLLIFDLERPTSTVLIWLHANECSVEFIYLNYPDGVVVSCMIGDTAGSLIVSVFADCCH